LVCIADDPGVRLREIGDRVGITERAAHRIIVELTAAGYITRERTGRRNRYTINADLRPMTRSPATRTSDTSSRSSPLSEDLDPMTRLRSQRQLGLSATASQRRNSCASLSL
jgi:DNA-binding IclR family transcriptional regulator